MADDNKPGLGSADMSTERKRRIQSLGGQSSPQNFKRNRKLARMAGQKGGQARKRNRRIRNINLVM